MPTTPRLPTRHQRTVTVTTELEARPEVVWAGVQSLRVFSHIAAPVVALAGTTELGRPVEVGDATRGRIRVFGVPGNVHHLQLVGLDHDRRIMRSNEHGGLLRSWNHDLIVEELPGGSSGSANRTRYTDRIDIDAGMLTPIVCTFAELFYRHRQRRWRRLAPLLDEVLTAHDSGQTKAQRAAEGKVREHRG